MKIRIGHGFDAHRFVTGRDLIMGGIKIPYSHGLDGHSDADVLLHAISDALLGAAALGDIGQHFSSVDDDLKGVNSRKILRDIVAMLAGQAFRPQQVDATIIAEQPKLAMFVPQMRACIAHDLQIDTTAVSIKATTTDGMGFAGNGEGICAHAVVIVCQLVDVPETIEQP